MRNNEENRLYNSLVNRCNYAFQIKKKVDIFNAFSKGIKNITPFQGAHALTRTRI